MERLIQKVSKEGREDPFYKPRILVRNQGMATWIRQQMASSPLGLAMNVDFPQPNAFLNEVMQTESVTLEELLWRVYDVLPKMLNRPSFRILRDYLDGHEGDQTALRRYQLASKVATLFDKYLLYRPEWIDAWDAGRRCTHQTHESWQCELWQAIGGATLSHWTRALQQLPQQLDCAKLPQAVHVFGASNFAPAYLRFLYALSHHIEVHIYWLNPVDGYWGDTPNKRHWILESSYTEEVDPFVCNPLIAAFGRMGREYMHNVYGGGDEEFLVQEEDLPPLVYNDQSTSHLVRLQRGLFENVVVSAPDEVEDTDASVSIHACHSPLREVEVLKNFLLKQAAHEPLDTGNVLIMCTDIQAYAPLIEAVFGSHNQVSEHPLPFRIADRTSPMDNFNIAVIPSLLGLGALRFTVQDALRILQTPAILARFELTKEDLNIIQNWLDTSGIRWGFDHDDVTQRVGAEIESFWSWEEGLQRMLLGMMMPQASRAEDALWNGLTPFTEIEGGNVRILSSLCDFVRWCQTIRQGLKGEKSLSAWLEDLRDWVRLGFSQDDEFQSQLFPFFTTLENLEQAAGYTEELLPASVFREHLSSSLQGEGAPFGFLSGSITFCEMKPMRTIPMDTICILGMNYDAFPRVGTELQFDLTRERRVEGDRNTRDDDLYLFLETLISARRRLFLSYVGYSINDGSPLPPSSTLQTLLDYTDGLEACVHAEKLHAFDPSYFDAVAPTSFEVHELDTARALVAPKVIHDSFCMEPSVYTGDILGKSIELDAFFAVLTNPCRHYFTQVLQAKIPYAGALVEENERMDVDTLQRWKLRRDLLGNSHASDARREVLKQTGGLPVSCLGDDAYGTIVKDVTELHESVPKTDVKELSFDHSGFHFHGKVQVSEEDGRLDVVLVSVSDASAKDQLRLRLNQLLLSLALNKPVSATLYYLSKKGVALFALEPDAAFETTFDSWFSLYQEAFQSPLPFFIKSLKAYSEVKPKRGMDEIQLEESRRAKAVAAWQPGEHQEGEKNDVYIKFFYDVEDPVSESFITYANMLWKPMLDLQPKSYH